ncbi:hypothetical protein K8R43_01765 [archaeon]|nr:hypothetical protein [archaeon]
MSLDFLPSVPKRLVVDSLLVLCVLILFIFTGISFFLMGVHEVFFGGETQSPVPIEDINVVPASPSTASPGDNITISVSLQNMRDEDLQDIKIRIVSSNVFDGAEASLEKLSPGIVEEKEVYVRIKHTAPEGDATGQVEVISGKYRTVKAFNTRIQYSG